MRLRTSRLVLRPIVASDADVVWSWRGSLPAVSLPGMRRFVRGVRRDPTRHTFIALAAGEPVGMFRIYERGLNDADIGCVLARPAQGLGYGTEGARALLDFGFRRLKLHRIWADCDVDNVRSIRLMTKLGMKREGRLREHRLVGRTWRDSLLFAILDHEWKRFR